MASQTQKTPVYFNKKVTYLNKRRFISAHMPFTTASWRILAHQTKGILITNVARSGLVTGTVFGNPLRGWYDKHSGKIVFLQFVKGNPSTGGNQPFYQGQLQKSLADNSFTITGSLMPVGGDTSAGLATCQWSADAIILL
ncbi:hypothetical protein BC351_06115 [Paenibacillus ferrarius]|uniref:Uncharacterized protein n=1 Tax=Paenibacillus ferrarius TaxID=1469647 RepID=A0A1V4HFA6_9BACL|nr:hypothetical protein [Paenibacillus ferrarius]OPH53435.1 hypothetical protein BC351_06115 [Paenibacillus ferrarius]